MISSIVISQLMDGNKSRENGVPLPVSCAHTQSPACSRKQPLADHSGVTIHRAFALLPGTWGTRTPTSERLGPEIEPLPKGEPPSGAPQRGFSSITITARRVGPPASALEWEAVGDPPCTKCRVQPALLGRPSAGADPPGRPRPVPCTGDSRSCSGVRPKAPETHVRPCEGHECWVTGVDAGEDGFSPDTPQEARGPLVFSSCVHLRVSQQCHSPTYAPDRPLSVPAGPRTARPQLHRSVLSVSLSCSSHSLTPDGAGAPANPEPVGGARRREPWPGPPGPWGPCWDTGLPEGLAKESPSLGQVHLGGGTCPRSASPLLDGAEHRDPEWSPITLRTGPGPCAPRRPRGGASQLSIHIPGWSYRAGGPACCDLVVKIKGSGERGALPAPEPQPAPPEEPDTPDPSEDCAEGQATPASPWTLQEALEAHKPQFISRSQERLKKLEHMIHQRKTQRKDPPAQTQSFLPVRAAKKQFTVPHPLSAGTAARCSGSGASPDSWLPADICKSSPYPLSAARQLRDRGGPQLVCVNMSPRSLLPAGAQGPSPSFPSPETPVHAEPCGASALAREEALQLPPGSHRAAGRVSLAGKASSARDTSMLARLHLSANADETSEACAGRIYDNLPEVRKKKEEQKKRVLLQSNRLRTEIFKKQLLDQLLQRKAV
ncbi:PREDICTED: centrosomal protein C10orf90 homolog [Condylura cristata]|uniref:centrosomal protein C10orf90 homolog n=1 Tax=Condylura cristata TaxID=143302 RepID=UPI0006432CBA|nr:PREDICTED: centrosomal protein C10orf90 homolog [Condylura cristata]